MGHVQIISDATASMLMSTMLVAYHTFVSLLDDLSANSNS